MRYNWIILQNKCSGLIDPLHLYRKHIFEVFRAKKPCYILILFFRILRKLHIINSIPESIYWNNAWKQKIHEILRSIICYIRSFNDPRREWNKKRECLRRKCITYFKKYGDEEQKALVTFTKNNKIFDFPYEWTKKYNSIHIEVYRENDFPYVFRNGKKLFGKKSMSNDDWKDVYKQILLEQDDLSTHKYLTDLRYPEKDSVFADIGAAEGFLALDVIDIVKKVYLFECDPEWIEALNMTFKNYDDKVEIINKYISDTNSDTTVSLDKFFKNKKVDYLKADIEGYEEKMLQGGMAVFDSKIKKCLLCCYHRNSAEEFFRDYLTSHGFDKIDVNQGYMIWTWAEEVMGEPVTPPYTRHGVMFAEKSCCKK